MARYAALCADMVRQFKDINDNPRVARVTCKTCLLHPDAPEAVKIPADRFLRVDTQKRPWMPATRALLALRQGKPEEAIGHVQECKNFPKVAMVDVANLPVLAMAYTQLGDKESAESALEAAAKEIEKLGTDQTPQGHHDLMTAQILFDEASLLIKNAGG